MDYIVSLSQQHSLQHAITTSWSLVFSAFFGGLGKADPLHNRYELPDTPHREAVPVVRMSLLNFPFELLLLIFEKPPSKDLKELALTCSAANNVVNGILFNTVHLNLYYSGSATLNRILRLAYVVSFSKREIGSKVKHLKLDLPCSDSVDTHRSQILVLELQRRQILASKEFADSLEGLVYNVPRFVEDLRCGLPIAYFRLLLLSCPEALCVSIRSSLPIDELWYLNKALPRNREQYKNIHRLNWSYTGDFSKCASANERMLLSLEQLEGLRTLRAVMNVRWKPFVSPRFNIGHLQELELMNCQLTLESLEKLLSSTPELRSFKLDLIEGCDWPKVDDPEGLCRVFAGNPEDVSPNDPKHEEKLWQSKLQTLVIQIRSVSDSDGRHNLEYRRDFGKGIGSLRHFPLLRFIETTPDLLFGNKPSITPVLKNVLPNSLEWLWLDRCHMHYNNTQAGWAWIPAEYHWWFANIINMTEAYAVCQDPLPNLKKLSLDPRFGYNSSWRKADGTYGRLMTSLNLRGIRFKEVTDYDSYWTQPRLFHSYEK